MSNYFNNLTLTQYFWADPQLIPTEETTILKTCASNLGHKNAARLLSVITDHSAESTVVLYGDTMVILDYRVHFQFAESGVNYKHCKECYSGPSK